MSDVKCPHCGGTNESNAAFCGTCGTPLATQPTAFAARKPACVARRSRPRGTSRHHRVRMRRHRRAQFQRRPESIRRPLASIHPWVPART